jgi:hypothetical protein
MKMRNAYTIFVEPEDHLGDDKIILKFILNAVRWRGIDSYDLRHELVADGHGSVPSTSIKGGGFFKQLSRSLFKKHTSLWG